MLLRARMELVGTHRSVWLSHARPSRPALDQDLAVDVCIVGAGVTGLTLGLLLARSGANVAVVEALAVASGDTALSTAHLSVHHDLWYRDTLERFGEDDARLVLETRRAAMGRIEALVAEHGIACAYRRVPAYLFTESGEGASALRAELDACARLGLEAEWIDHDVDGVPVRGALRFAGQAELDPVRYAEGLAHAIERAGGRIFEGTHVASYEQGRPCRVRTERATIACDDLVLATHAPLGSHGFLITKVAAYRTYAIAVRIERARGATPPSCLDALLWDDGDPYHYVRAARHRGHPVLLVGGEDHKTGQPGSEGEAWRALEGWARARFPLGEVVERWSGQILEPADGLPYVGLHEDHVWVATGYGGDGIVNGTLAATMLAQELAGERSASSRLYEPSRFGLLASAKEYVKENVDYPTHLVVDRLRRPEADRVDDVRRGEGKLVRLGRDRVAVHRSDDGRVHAFSPVCPHMGCHVRWNGDERSWDCPCHGSRFDAETGRVLNGPATRGLSPRSLEEAIERPSSL